MQQFTKVLFCPSEKFSCTGMLRKMVNISQDGLEISGLVDSVKSSEDIFISVL